tara:strand:- start:154 stop:579 length:426 start_codon:yes stop_codon:yes gene_type:complete
MNNFFLKIFIFFSIFETPISFAPIVNNKISKSNHNRKLITNLKMNQDICPEYLDKFTNLLNEDQSHFIVKSISGFLTKVDSIGGYILHTNDVIINCILNNDILPLEEKKSIILFFIKFSQYGDSGGSHILQLYHDLVNCLL